MNLKSGQGLKNKIVPHLPRDAVRGQVDLKALRKVAPFIIKRQPHHWWQNERA